MNKYKKAVYDIGKILFDREDDYWDEYEADTACELICRKLYALGLLKFEEKEEGDHWEASKKLVKYIEKRNK